MSRVVDRGTGAFWVSYATSVELDALCGVGRGIVGVENWLERDESYERRVADASREHAPMLGDAGATAGFSSKEREGEWGELFAIGEQVRELVG